MRSVRQYFIALFSCFVSATFIATFYAPTGVPAKFSLPSFKEAFVSVYGDHDAIHRIIYHGLFNFGKRMRDADILLIGNSHMETGFSAEQISNALSAKTGKKIKAINLGVGWGEAFPFHKLAIANNHLSCKVILLELYATLEDRFSVVAKPILAESRMTAYSKVLEAWAITGKDWLLDGIYPRITYDSAQFTRKRFLAYPVGFRKWKNGDIVNFWFPNNGEVYQQTPRYFVSYPKAIPNAQQADVAAIKKVLDPLFLQKRSLTVITTLMPSNDLDKEYYVRPMKQLGFAFINIPYQGIELYDSYHSNAVGRNLATTKILNVLENNAAFKKLWPSLENKPILCYNVQHFNQEKRVQKWQEFS